MKKSTPILLSACAVALTPATALSQEEPAWIPLFNGTNPDGWKLKQDDEAHRPTWQVVSSVKLDPQNPKNLTATGEGGETGILFRQPIESGSDIFTTETFGDCELRLEFMVAQGSNSGIYLMGQYELQVLDSHGKADTELSDGDLGAIYSVSPPLKNAAKAPGEWQSYHIIFKAPRFDAAGKKTSDAEFVSVKLNGVEVQKNTTVKGPTGGELPGGETARGPLMIQGDHGIVALRNIELKPLAD